ncbi:MAG: LpqB family beta-propeller domain-containing protein, partial [Longimicrobiales bacterium]
MSTQAERLVAALADRYRIERELGMGGMATVYLAHDIKHDRQVALKVLKAELAAVLGADRFVQEIKTTAALQHPHILPLFDSGTADSFLYYVMPFIDGETLRSKLDRETQLGIDEAVRITVAIAEALDYAHRRGVIHRDIKPENILLHEGRPMVADFGIALAVSAAAGGRMTETGLSLGTPHYMSPEQATGEKEISARSDIYSLASVLYEMLTGNPPHTGASAQQIIMKIVTEEAAPVTKLRKSVPPNVAAAVAKGVERLPADRFETAAAFAEALKNPSFRHGDTGSEDARFGAARRRWRDPVTIALAAIAVVAIASGFWARGDDTSKRWVGKYAVTLDSTALLAYRGSGEPARLALTPDGQTLVYVGTQRNGTAAEFRLFIRPLGNLEARELPGTTGASRPVISPDGAQVAFLSANNDQLRVAPLSGGPVITLADSAIASGPSWGPDGFVYFITRAGIVRRVSGAGGPSEDVVQLPPAPADAAYRWLVILPGGRGAIVGRRAISRADESAYMLDFVDLRNGKIGLTFPGLAARYVASEKALVYVTADGSLMAVPFDVSALKVRGRPQSLVTGGATRNGETDLDIASGTLVYARQGRNGVEYMSWVPRNGGQPLPLDSAWLDTEFEAFQLSPDGRRLAITIGGGAGRTANQDRYDIWIKQLDEGPISRLTFAGEANDDPSWTADGNYVSYLSLRGGHRSLWRRRADGVGEEQLVVDAGARDIVEVRWSTDGQWLIASVAGPPSFDLMFMRLSVDKKLRPLLAEPHAETKPALSRDSKWLAYVSNESGRAQVFVRPFPNVMEGKWQVSLEGG